MTKILFIGIGGFIGAILRYLISGFAQQFAKGSEFPYGTLVVNVLGCLIIGFGSQLIEARDIFSIEIRALIFIGILGGFTTFATFGHETINLLHNDGSLIAFTNITTSLLLCLSSVWLGRMTAHLVS